MNWRTATTSDRKVLYEVVSDIIWQNDLKWEDVFKAAFPDARYVGRNYQDGFRAGKIGRKRALWIHNWLRSEHPETCDLLEQRLTGHGE